MATINQYRRLATAREFDIGLVHRGMALAGPAFLERRLANVLPLVYDFDDAIHLLHTSDANREFGWLKLPQKTAEICRIAGAVTVGNEYLADFARRHNQSVAVVPSSVDTAIYAPGLGSTSTAQKVIGWMGSSTSQSYLEPFAPLLSRIASLGLIVRIVSDRKPAAFRFPHEWREWSASSEVDDLRSFDVGIMPLPDTEWAKGKCAMKLIQYMGVGVPSIGSAIGENLELIQDGENGFLAASEDEWMEKILRLVRNPELSQRLGDAGRETVMARYSAEICAGAFAKVLRKAATKSPRPGR